MSGMIHADTVGSFLRPNALHRARAAYAAGAIDAAALRDVEDDAIRDVVAMQEELGLPVVTDGEFRRENWWIDFVSRLRGVEIREGDRGAVVTAGVPGSHDYVPKKVITTGRLETDGPVTVDDYAFVAELSSQVAKITVPSPTRLHFHGGRSVVSTSAYPDIDAFFADLATIYRHEIAALEAAGCRYVQIDDPLLSYFLSPHMRAAIVAEGDDPDARLTRYIRLINDCIALRQPGTRIGLHICRGNARSLALSEGPYDGIAEACFAGLAVDRFLLEYDDARSGDFSPLRFIPADKEVVLGLITTKRPDLEDEDTLKHRIDEAARYVAPARLAISPQCGFASVVEGNAVTEADQRAKLRLVVKVARAMWGD